MNKLLDLLAEIEASVEWAVDDRKDRENIMDWIHQAMDIAVKGKAHKWPEEKPENLTWVLIRNKSHFGNTHNSVSWYVEDEGFYVAGFDEPFDGVTHWWELPEVAE